MAPNTMVLFYQTHSPYARKVLVAAHELGLAARIRIIHQETSPTSRNDDVFRQNPLGKVPVLIRDDSPPIFDSDVICAYFDTLHDGDKLAPSHGEARWRALTLQALAQGMNDCGIALRWETVRRPEPLRYQPLKDGYAAKLIESFDWLENQMQQPGAVDLGQIAVATCLSWLEFRDLPSFRPGRPALSTWFDDFCERASMKATPLTGDTVDEPVIAETRK